MVTDRKLYKYGNAIDFNKMDTIEIKGLGKVGIVYNSFDKQLKALDKAGAKFPYVMDVRNIAYMRLNKGSKNGARTRHAPIYAKDSPIILARVSPLIKDFKMAEQAVKANRNGKYFVAKDTEVYDIYAKIAEKDKSKNPSERRALILSSKEIYLIKPNSEEAQALFKDTRKEYFETFCKNGINFYPVSKDFVNSKKGSLVEYLWFERPDYVSVLFGNCRDLYDDIRAFGVLSETSEAGSKKISAPTLDQVIEVLKNKYVPEYALPAAKKDLSKLFK